MEQLLLSECQIEQQIDHDIDILLEKGAFEVCAFDIVVEIDAGAGLV
jgi:hypothetical protein